MWYTRDMPKPFDATLKELITAHPVDWLAQLGVPITAPPEVLSADLSTVTAAADTLIKVGDLIVHIDVESGPDELLARRMLLYNVLAHHRTGLPVRSVAVLLRSKAVGGGPTDGVEYAPNPGVSELRFRFETVKVWEVPAEDWLKGGVGLLPLAVLGKPPPGLSHAQAFEGIAGQIVERVKDEAKDDVGVILTASTILAAMHVPAAFAKEVFNKMIAMHELEGYKFIMNEGAVLHARKIVRTLGSARFGEPTEQQANKLDVIDDLERLDRLALAVLTATDWDALLRVK